MRTIFNLSEEGLVLNTVGNKAVRLSEIKSLGINVPNGFVLSAEATHIDTEEFMSALDKLERQCGKKYGSPYNPLLLAVRSSSVHSMPGMLDSILNVGLNDVIVDALLTYGEDPSFVYSIYADFLKEYSEVVFNFYIDEIFDDLSPSERVLLYKKQLQESRIDFPQSPYEQLRLAIAAIKASWERPRAIVYRDAFNIPHTNNLAVIVQEMVFGTRDRDCGSGVLFTRNPITGVKEFYGEYLPEASGRKIVSGETQGKDLDTLETSIKTQLYEAGSKLEAFYKDMQDVEFTYQRGKLYILQTRSGKRTAEANIVINVDMVNEGLISIEEAVSRVTAEDLERIRSFELKDITPEDVIATGLAVSPGVVSGLVVFHAEEAFQLSELGITTILVKEETTPDDLSGIMAAGAVVTMKGNATSHTAVVTRSLNKPAIVGVGTLKVSHRQLITVDAYEGRILRGAASVIERQPLPQIETLLKWKQNS